MSDLKKLLSLGFCLALLTLVGCAVKLPPISTYVLTSPHTMASLPQHPRTQLTLYVSPMRANPGYTTNSMIYVKTPSYLSNYAQHQWVAPPAEMLLPLITQQIQAKGYFRAVVMSPFVGTSDFRLDTRLVLLQQEFLQPVSQVRCVVQATLIKNSTHRAVASQRFQALVPAPGNNAESGVAAANQASRQIAEQMAEFVSSPLR